MITDNIIEAVLADTEFAWCPQGAHVVQVEDFEPRAGMCGACISEAVADAGEFFASRGLVASAEEMAFND